MNKLPRFLQQFTFLLTVIVAMASLKIMYNVGSNQQSILLIVLFTGWVLSAFIGMLILNLVSGRLKLNLQFAVHALTVILNLGSLVLYNGIFNPPDMKPAAIFLMVPLVTWVILVIVSLLLRKQLQAKGPAQS